MLKRTESLAFHTSAKGMWQSSAYLLLAAFICLPFFDMELAHTEPGAELAKMGQGLLHMNFAIEGLFNALFQTLAFALQSVLTSVLLGFVLALTWHWPGVRQLMTCLRSIHELFWALILIQIFGLSALTGVLALTIPYSATFARVFAEILEETPKYGYFQLKGSHFSRFVYSTLPRAWPRLVTYSRYRLECALRASVMLGFIGLPTLGFHLEGFLKLGRYAEVSAIVLLFVLLVLSLRWWTRRVFLSILFFTSVVFYPPLPAVDIAGFQHLLLQFFLDIVPTPIRVYGWQVFELESWLRLADWFLPLWRAQIMPGTVYTLVLGQLALLFSALLGLLWFPMICRSLTSSSWMRRSGFFFLVVLRCLPEILLAFIALIFLGPSLLPGVLAVGLHNGALLAHLVGHYSNEFQLRSDCHTGLSRYFYEVLPRVYAQFLAFALYRGEVILRETAVLGILGIPTLGFYIDSAFEEFRFDRAALLILITVIINVAAEYLALNLRRRIKLGARA